MYSIEIANQQSLLKIDEEFLRRVVEETLSAEQTAAAEISIALVDDETIHSLNKRHLGHDYATDVLSFLFDSVREHRGKRIDGEVIVSAETAIDRAAESNGDPRTELALYLIHGLLHLLGYNDTEDSERTVMRSRERDMLQLCELSPGVES